MESGSWRRVTRRKCKRIMLGGVAVGGDAPISVQTMTNTATVDTIATIKQIERCTQAGAEIVRVSCPNMDSALALREIVKHAGVPIVADVHFHYKIAIAAAQAGAACLRINPGNIGNNKRVVEVVKAAKDHNCAMRIGVNAGSLERRLLEKYRELCPQALVESALYHVKILEDSDFTNLKIAVKASDVFTTYVAYKQLAEACDYPLHVGVTESGGLHSGTVRSAIGIGRLLWEGVGDTIRVSLSADPIEEVKAGFSILKSLGLRHRGVNVISCPSCARQAFDVINTVSVLERRLEHIKTPMTLSVLGCIVNGIGEAKHADIGFIGGGNHTHQVYVQGLPSHRLKQKNIVDHIVKLVEEKAQQLECQKLHGSTAGSGTSSMLLGDSVVDGGGN